MTFIKFCILVATILCLVCAAIACGQFFDYGKLLDLVAMVFFTAAYFWGVYNLTDFE